MELLMARGLGREWLGRALVTAGTVVLLLGLAVRPAASQTPEPERDQFGNHHELKEWDGYTVVDFAASWCVPCYAALPRLQELAAEHDEVRFLVISVDEKQAGRDRLVVELDLGLPVIWDGNHRIAEHFAPQGFPATFVLDPQGEVVYSHTGTGKKKHARLVEFLNEVAGDS
jgi:thiol-disulfide isomerase/thioredoxin